jgi:hypothetical protein
MVLLVKIPKKDATVLKNMKKRMTRKKNRCKKKKMKGSPKDKMPTSEELIFRLMPILKLAWVMIPLMWKVVMKSVKVNSPELIV